MENYEELVLKCSRLEQYIEELEKENEDKSRFIAQISHEVRTPLNVVIGMANIAKEEIDDYHKVNDCLNEIEGSSRKLLSVVNDILDVVSLSNGLLQINNAKFDLKEQITNLAVLFYEQAKQRNIHFGIHIKGVTDEYIIGDEKRLTQIIVSILSNAIRYTPQEGRVDLTVLQASTSRDRVHMRFIFKDTGRGIPKEVIDTIFGNAKEDNKTDAVMGSESSLGLSLGKMLIDMMHGTVAAKSEAGEGTEIVVDIPFTKTEQSDMVSLKKISKIKTLIVSDDCLECESRGEMLTDMGLLYDVAYDADKALDMLGTAEECNEPYGLCMVNWNAHKFSGKKLIEDIRHIFGDSLIIITTAHNALKCHDDGISAGANYVIDSIVFRSTMFDALMKLEKGELVQADEEIGISQKYDFSGKSILVVEDVPLNMEVVVKLLSKVKVSVVCAENGQEAINAFLRKPSGYFDCIFMDINMPVVDGYTATRKIRESNKADAKTIPIFAMTANAFTKDITQALDAGMNGHIAKPLDVGIIYRTLDRLFNGSGIFEEDLMKKTELLEEQNERLRMKAEHDPLTGLLNRYGFEKYTSQLIYKNEPVGFLIIDIDRFKQVNDTYGHEIGDKVLVEVANRLKSKFRTTDYVARFGGDEFVVLLYNYAVTDRIVKRKVHEINDELAKGMEGLPQISISAGLVISHNGYSTHLYEHADKALYYTKEHGRSGCSVYDSSM